MTSLTLAQVSVSILLVISILMQNRGSGLGGAFGGDSFSSYHTKRGFEKFVFYFSIVMAFLFIVLGVASVMTQS